MRSKQTDTVPDITRPQYTEVTSGMPPRTTEKVLRTWPKTRS